MKFRVGFLLLILILTACQPAVMTEVVETEVATTEPTLPEPSVNTTQVPTFTPILNNPFDAHHPQSKAPLANLVPPAHSFGKDSPKEKVAVQKLSI